MSMQGQRRNCEEGRKQNVECGIFFFQAEDGIRDVERSRGLGDVYRDRVEMGAA